MKYQPVTLTDAQDGIYAIPFPYLEENHVLVHVDGVLQTSGYTFNGKLLEYNPKPPGLLIISRKTPIDMLYIMFADGVPITSPDMNEAFTWLMYSLEEIHFQHNDDPGAFPLKSSAHVVAKYDENGDPFPGLINALNIALGAITEEKIDNDAISNSKIANEAVSQNKIRDGAVTESKIDPDLLDKLDSIDTFAEIINLLNTTEPGQTHTNARLLIDYFRDTHDLALPYPPRSTEKRYFAGQNDDTFWEALPNIPNLPNAALNSDTQTLKARAGNAFWESTNEVPDAGSIHHVLTVIGPNDQDYAWRPLPEGMGGTGGAAITIQNDGTDLTTAAEVINFTGNGVTASGSGINKTIAIPGFAPTQQNLYQAVKDILHAGEHTTLTESDVNSAIVINSEGPGDPGSLEFVVLSPRNIQGETATSRQSYNITAAQELFAVQVEKSGGGNTNGLYPRQLIRRSELSSVSKRYVFDTHNPQNSDNKSVAIDVSIVSSVLFIEVRTPADPLVVTIREVAAIMGGLKGEKGEKGEKGDEGDVGPAGKDAELGDPKGLKIAETTFTLDESATVTAQDWTLTSDSLGNLIDGLRLSLRTNRPTASPRDHTARIGYMFELTRVAGLGSTTDSEAIYFYGEEERLVMGLNAQVATTLVHGKIDLILNYNTGNYVDVTLGNGVVDSRWASTTFTQTYTLSVYELVIKGQKGDKGDQGLGAALGDRSRDIAATSEVGDASLASRTDHTHGLNVVENELAFTGNNLGFASSFKTNLAKFGYDDPSFTPEYWLRTNTERSFILRVDSSVLTSTVTQIRVTFPASTPVAKTVAVRSKDVHVYPISLTSRDVGLVSVPTTANQTLNVTIDYLQSDNTVETTQTITMDIYDNPPEQDVHPEVFLTQAEYDALTTKDTNTYYNIY